MDIFGKGVNGWEGLRDDIRTFAKLIGFRPTHEQAHYLLRVQNGADRLGLVKNFNGCFPIMATCMIWRALCWDIPSICLTEFHEHGESWVRLISAWLQNADVSVKSNVELSVSKQWLVANRVRICHVIGPFTDDYNYIPGRQDILLLDFNEMPSSRITRAFELAEGALLYLPQTPHGALVQHRHRQNDGDGSKGDPSARS